ncbi:unnamed protein product [Lymnaea stagnalis]|uniref:RRM domain-containing protein n=1 Tax=Lymnaea stagnalis TaxID=6523 RepID=A0AAV2I426_LYMST
MENDVKTPEKKQEDKQEIVTPGSGKPEKSRIKQELDTPGKLMVSGIPKHEEFTEAQLEKEFAPFGRITEVNIIRDRRSSLPRGFAFITYENPQDSEDAIKAMEGKDLGGEMPIHCEQAVIGLRKTKKMTEDARGGVRGGPRGRGGRGGDRGGRGWDRGGRGWDRGGRGWDRGGRGRGMERGRGWDMGRGFGDRGGPRGRGMQGGPHYGGERFNNEMGMYEEEEYYDEFEYGDAGYEEFTQQRGNRGGMFRGPPGRGRPMGRGGPPGRGNNFGRGAPQDRGGPPGRGRGGPSENVPMRGHDFRGGPSRRALLPNPPARGSRGPYAGQMRGQPAEEYYGEDANGYQGEEYFESSEAYEGYDDHFAEEAGTSEEYYMERPDAPRGRGGALPRGRGRPDPLQTATRQNQVDEYGYSYEEQSMPQRVPRPQANMQRRAPPPLSYSEEVYEEETPDTYDRPRANVPVHGASRGGRGAPVSRGTPVVRGALLSRGGPNGRGAPAGRGAPPGRRTALLGAEPYADESMYKRQPVPVAGNYAGPGPYEEDPYRDSYNRRPAPTARQAPAGRPRPAVASGDDMYVMERPHDKPQALVGDQPPVRHAAMGPTNRYPDYQTSAPLVGREQFSDARRLPPRRVDPDIRMREDPYQRVAAETDAYVSYPPSSRVAAEPVVSDPYSRKRPIDQYEEGDVSRGIGAPVTGVKRDYREYEDYRSAQAQPKRERLDRSGVYEAYSSRQEGAYRGL